MTVILHQVQGGASPRSVTAARHPIRKGASPRSVTAARHPTLFLLVVLKAVSREQEASRVRVRAVGAVVGAEDAAGVRAAVTRANRRAVVRAASGVGTGPWRR